MKTVVNPKTPFDPNRLVNDTLKIFTILESSKRISFSENFLLNVFIPSRTIIKLIKKNCEVYRNTIFGVRKLFYPATL